MIIDNSNTTAAYGKFNIINQIEFFTSFWIDINSITNDDNSKVITMFSAIETGIGANINLRLLENGGVYTCAVFYRTDAGEVILANFSFPDFYSEVSVYWKASSGIGANDGIIYITVNGVIVVSETTLDNDTRQVDDFRYGTTFSNWVNPIGEFYMDSIYLDAGGGAIYPLTLAVHDGDYGMAIPNFDTSMKNCEFSIANQE